MQNLIFELKSADIPCKENEPLSSYTTFRIGGPAKLFVSVDNCNLLHQVLCFANKHKTPFFVLGKGSNILVSDKGFDGLVIFNNATFWKILEDFYNSKQNINKIEKRFDQPVNSIFSSNQDDETTPILIEVESGAIVGQLMKQLFKEGISGLEYYSGIPSTVGGAIYMNMHGADHFFGELVHSAFISNGNETREVYSDYFKFDYDWSILHETREVILKTKLILKRGEIDKAREAAKNWARYKANQPWRSAGCIFQNLTEEQKEQANLPSVSIGYLVDKVLDLKGTRIGDAVISENHAAFIENVGEAKAKDVYKLIDLIKDRAKAQQGIELKMEVQFVGDFNA